jgi:hypothetical protein
MSMSPREREDTPEVEQSLTGIAESLANIAESLRGIRAILVADWPQIQAGMKETKEGKGRPLDEIVEAGPGVAVLVEAQAGLSPPSPTTGGPHEG